jgi:hypothetical protein
MPLADERSAPLTVTAPVAFSEDIPRVLRTGRAPLVHRTARRR